MIFLKQLNQHIDSLKIPSTVKQDIKGYALQSYNTLLLAPATKAEEYADHVLDMFNQNKGIDKGMQREYLIYLFKSAMTENKK